MERGLSKKGINLHSSVVVMFVFMAAILTDSLSHGQVGVEPNRALLKEGESTDLLCRYGKSINYCRIEIPGEKVLNLSPNWNKTPGFKYYGHGLTAGQCGVTIEHASAKHNGLVKCSLGVEGEEEVGTIDLVVALSPEQPLIELLSKPERDGSFVEGTQLQARCIVRNGRPAANISWLVDGLPADKRMSDSEVIESPIDGNNIVYTTIGKIQWHLTPEDNGRKLICRSHHQTRDQDAVYQTLVRYAPIKQPEVMVYGLYLEQTAMVNITIRANPSPVIEWNIDGLPIVPGDRNERYSAYEPRYLGKDLYNITLAIAGLTLEDTTKTYLLKASNALGLQEYTVRISSSSTPPSAGLDVGSIVGIVVALAILIVIVLLIIFARATGRWCFGGATLNTDIGPDSEAQINPHLNDDFDGREFGGKSIKSPTSETSDTESAEVKTKITKKQPTLISKHLPTFTALFSRKNEKSTNKDDAKSDAELNNGETSDSAGGEDNSANGSNGNDPNKPKEDKQLVYAELVLKPSENNQPLPSKTSTEYAEIAYVQPKPPVSGGELNTQSEPKNN